MCVLRAQLFAGYRLRGGSAHGLHAITTGDGPCARVVVRLEDEPGRGDFVPRAIPGTGWYGILFGSSSPTSGGGRCHLSSRPYSTGRLAWCGWTSPRPTGNRPAPG